MSDLKKIFDKQYEIDERAWDVFSAEYERRNPPPVQGQRWQRWGLNAGLFSAMVVSSIFTVQAFLEVFQYAGVHFALSAAGSAAAFVMIDVILFFLTHFVIMLAYKPMALAGEMNSRVVLHIAIGITVFTFFVSIASNLYFMFIGFGVVARGGEAMRTLGFIVGLLLGTAPPIQSIAVGTIVAMTPLQLLLERNGWEESKQRAWFGFRRKHNLDTAIERLSTVSQQVSDGTGHGTGVQHASGYSQASDASKQVRDYLLDNTQDMDRSVRDLANIIGVGKSTVSRVKRELEREMQNGNG